MRQIYRNKTAQFAPDDVFQYVNETRCDRVCSLEQDVKKLKADLQASRQLEQELRSQISSLNSTERNTRSELDQLHHENELLQNK